MALRPLLPRTCPRARPRPPSMPSPHRLRTRAAHSTKRTTPVPPASNNSTSTSTSASTTTTTTTARIDRILARLPPRLRSYASGLRRAPVSHVAAFLVLHELTAIGPLLALFALFHYAAWAPAAYVAEHWSGYVREGVGRAERYFRRKAWFGFAPADAAADGTVDGGDGGDDNAKYQVLAEAALAYAVTKVLLPVRIVVSLWATPWFAGVLVSARRLVGRG